MGFFFFFTFWRFFFNSGSPECSLLSFSAFFGVHFHPPLHRTVSSFCTFVFHLPGKSLQPLGELALVGAHVVDVRIPPAAAHLPNQDVSLLCARSSCAQVPLWSFCHHQGCFCPCGKSCAGSHCHAPAEAECASVFPHGKRASAWEADSLVGFPSASPPPQCQSALSSCRSAEGEFLHSPVFSSSLASSAYFLHLLDFPVPRRLQKMDSSALGPALPRKCSLSLGVQRLLQGSNHGAWRNNRDLSLGLFLQPPCGFSLLRSFPGSTCDDTQKTEPAREAGSEVMVFQPGLSLFRAGTPLSTLSDLTLPLLAASQSQRADS